MSRQAIVWIRDGVLVNRMHVNPVAFALAYWLFIDPPGRGDMRLEQLINFGFAKSGVSCAEKMKMFSAEYGSSTKQCLIDVDGAAAFYNELATAMALPCTYFDGTVNLVKRLHEQGTLNFISSAVEQSVLDSWARTTAGLELSPYLTEILGKRPGFVKGRDHLAHVARLTEGGAIYFVADAPAEIAMASQLSREFKIVPIAFAYVVQKDDVMDALTMAEKIILSPAAPWLSSPPHAARPGEIAVQEALIALPDAAQVVDSLRSAGANIVVEGQGQSIMSALSSSLPLSNDK